ncbi:helix-turn-helix domain-containing protein [Candidatus Daviesbacteria bacterium]|nr:helix-turn-helix domain-containing protein [Candidatus Daviesbacteria bacterium]
MTTKTVYNFPEGKLGPDFAKENLKNFKQLIDAALSFVVVSMPGVGVSYFLKYLATQNFARFIHVDLYNLPTLSQHEFYKLLLSELGGMPGSKTDEQMLTEIKKALNLLSQNREKIVIIFSRFDQLKGQFDWNFLSNIQSLTTVSPGSPRSTRVEAGKIVLIFTATTPLHDIAPDALSGGNLNFYSENLYFKPYSARDLEKLLSIEPARPGLAKPTLEKLLALSGGHNQLLHILLSSQKQHNLLLDHFVKLQLKELVDYLDYHQRKTLQKIALGKNVNEVDEYLLGVGMVKNSSLHPPSSNFQLFTPLLTEYIKTNMQVKLPVKEAKLFKLLRANMGRTVSKDEIFNVVWQGHSEGATDWALDALIYRLRKHPFMKNNNYIIESQKKVGYSLIQT